MLLELRVNNFAVFNQPVVLNLQANGHEKRLACNVHRDEQGKALKTVALFGPNNAGKSKLVYSLKLIRDILLNAYQAPFYPALFSNIYTKKTVIDLGVTFESEGRVFCYDFSLETTGAKKFLFESFAELTNDKYGNQKKDIWLHIGKGVKKPIAKDKELTALLPALSQNNLIMYVVNTDSFEFLLQIKHHLTAFAQKIVFLDMNDVDISQTISILKNKAQYKKELVEFIRMADIYLEDVHYASETEHLKMFDYIKNSPVAKETNNPNVVDLMHLVSVYKKKSVPSIVFDSVGTKKIIAIASFILDALKTGKVLIVDELDSSLHFQLTRAIVTLFNNALNDSAQLIFTTHDACVLDCKRLFRKDQIWFVHKEDSGVFLYPLSNFTAREGIRETIDVLNRYQKGILGALPSPDFIEVLLSLKKTGAPKKQETK